MPTNKYLESLFIQLKKYDIPGWLYDDLHKVALPTAGGQVVEKEDDNNPESLEKPPMFHVERLSEMAKTEEFWKSAEQCLPIAVGPEWSGIRAIAEKQGDGQRMWIKGCEEIDLFEKLPDLKKDFAKISGDYILDFDLGIKKAGKRLPAAEHSKLKAEEITLEQDEKIVATVLDAPYVKADIRDLPFKERKNRIKSLLQNAPDSIKISPDKFVSNRNQFEKAVKWAFGFDKSEGAIGKAADGKYTEDVVAQDGEPKDHLEKSYEVSIAKIREEKQIASFIVTDPYEVDADGHWISPAEAEDYFYTWMEKSRKIKSRHEKEAPAVIVGGWLVPYPSEQDYKAAMANEPHSIYDMNLGNDRAKSGSPIVDIKVTVKGHKIWQQLKNGELNAVSIGGRGILKAVPKSTMPEIIEVIKIG